MGAFSVLFLCVLVLVLNVEGENCILMVVGFEKINKGSENSGIRYNKIGPRKDNKISPKRRKTRNY